MREPAVVEAGTGTGKRARPTPQVCRALNKKVIISTSNKALQMQLVEKDLPFLQRIWPGKKVAVSAGKGNYECRFWGGERGEAISGDGAVRLVSAAPPPATPKKSTLLSTIKTSPS
ncbi:MAG: hypothetical protein IPM07_30985 [Anaerolineales bacterium]|nr:hypothetical protein [Anaerolineales bacterium]